MMTQNCKKKIIRAENNQETFFLFIWNKLDFPVYVWGWGYKFQIVKSENGRRFEFQNNRTFKCRTAQLKRKSH